MGNWKVGSDGDGQNNSSNNTSFCLHLRGGLVDGENKQLNNNVWIYYSL